MRSIACIEIFAEENRLWDADSFFFIKVYLLAQSCFVESYWICKLYIVFALQ